MTVKLIMAILGKKKRIVIILVILQFTTAIQSEEAGLAEKSSEIPDSHLHFLAGMSVAFLSSALAIPIVANEHDVYTELLISGIGVSSSVLAGALKELIDQTGFGNPEWRDFFSTVFGGLVASSLVFIISRSLTEQKNEPTGCSLLLGGYGVVLMIPVIQVMVKQRGSVKNNHLSLKSYGY